MSWIKEAFYYNSVDPETFVDRVCAAVCLSKISIMKLKHSFRRLTGVYNCYLLKLFGSYEYIFVTGAKINLSAMEKDYKNFNEAYCVEGALFDLNTMKFISFGEKKKKAFYKFVIYDGGIPHMVLNDETHGYTIMYIFPGDKPEYRFLNVSDSLSIVSHTNYEYREKNPKLSRKRVFFYKKYENDCFMVLDELVFAKKIKNAAFDGCVISDLLQDDINRAYYKDRLKEVGRTEFVSEDDVLVTTIPLNGYLIGGDSFVVTHDDLGKYGCKVFLFLNDKISYKRSYSCFDCKSVGNNSGINSHLLVECMLAVNDYDNEKIVFDATTRKVIWSNRK